jgi:flagellar capping protein FliD
MVAIPSTQALEKYQTTTNWFTQTRNAKSSQELNKSYSFNFSTYSSSLFSERVAGSIAKIITSANQLHASAESFRSADTALLNNRIVASSDNTSVQAKADKGTDLKAVEVSVQSLATTQTNSGAAFNADSTTVLQTGTQNFAITTGNKTTEVSFYANSEYTHQTVLNLIKDAISNSESGVSAKIVKDAISSNLHLELTSKDTGTAHALL